MVQSDAQPSLLTPTPRCVHTRIPLKLSAYPLKARALLLTATLGSLCPCPWHARTEGTSTGSHRYSSTSSGPMHTKEVLGVRQELRKADVHHGRAAGAPAKAPASREGRYHLCSSVVGVVLGVRCVIQKWSTATPASDDICRQPARTPWPRTMPPAASLPTVRIESVDRKRRGSSCRDLLPTAAASAAGAGCLVAATACGTAR